jgi:O-6-methylguanine DNA methyltransferase
LADKILPTLQARKQHVPEVINFHPTNFQIIMNFFNQVYELVRLIPEGKVTTYGDIAGALGTKDSRRVGHALHANKDGDETPCHRVVTRW